VLWFAATWVHGPPHPGPVSTAHAPPVCWNRTAAESATPGADTPPNDCTMTSRPSFSVMAIRTLDESDGKVWDAACCTSAGTEARSGAPIPSAAAAAEPKSAAVSIDATVSAHASSAAEPRRLGWLARAGQVPSDTIDQG